MPKAMLYLESFNGAGHHRTQSELARKLQERGWEVVIVTGNKVLTEQFDFGNAEIAYLPGVAVKHTNDSQSSGYERLTCYGTPYKEDKAWQAERIQQLKNIYDRIKPDAVLTDLWPYGRLDFDFEMLPFMEHIAGSNSRKPQIYSLVRDFTYTDFDNYGFSDRHEIIRKYFDYLMIRADPNFAPLEKIIGQNVGYIPDDLRSRINYVGYFANPLPKKVAAAKKDREVLVTSGGGVTTESIILFKAAIGARHQSKLKNRTWRILVPPNCPEILFNQLTTQAKSESPEGGIIVEYNRKDFPNLLANAALIICHGGDTIFEAASAGIPLIVMPRSLSIINQEQQKRTQCFAEKGIVLPLEYTQVRDHPDMLAKAIDQVDLEISKKTPLMISGAQRLADFMCRNLSPVVETKFKKVGNFRSP